MREYFLERLSLSFLPPMTDPHALNVKCRREPSWVPCLHGERSEPASMLFWAATAELNACPTCSREREAWHGTWLW